MDRFGKSSNIRITLKLKYSRSARQVTALFYLLTQNFDFLDKMSHELVTKLSTKCLSNKISDFRHQQSDINLTL